MPLSSRNASRLVSREEAPETQLKLLKTVRQRLAELRENSDSLIHVPLNSVGFFEGRVGKVDRVYVQLGSEYVVQCSRQDALEILMRREAALECQIEGNREERTTLVAATNAESGKPETEDKVLAMLEFLEQLEANAEDESQQLNNSPLSGRPMDSDSLGAPVEAAQKPRGLKKGFLLNTKSPTPKSTPPDASVSEEREKTEQPVAAVVEDVVERDPTTAPPLTAPVKTEEKGSLFHRRLLEKQRQL